MRKLALIALAAVVSLPVPFVSANASLSSHEATASNREPLVQVAGRGDGKGGKKGDHGGKGHNVYGRDRGPDCVLRWVETRDSEGYLVRRVKRVCR